MMEKYKLITHHTITNDQHPCDYFTFQLSFIPNSPFQTKNFVLPYPLDVVLTLSVWDGLNKVFLNKLFSHKWKLEIRLIQLFTCP